MRGWSGCSNGGGVRCVRCACGRLAGRGKWRQFARGGWVAVPVFMVECGRERHMGRRSLAILWVLSLLLAAGTVAVWLGVNHLDRRLGFEVRTKDAWHMVAA